MTQVANLLEGLNPAQREAVETVDGPLLIIAGPGSGKTRVITHRIAYLVQEYGVSPYSILAMTFTNKAAREMTDRLGRLAGPHAGALTVGTFHSFCARLLRIEGDFIGLSRNYSIFDDDDQISAIKQCLGQADYDPKRYPPRAVLSAISRAKNVLQDSQAMARDAAGYYFEEVCARVYRHYEELLARNNAVDFDDLLLRTVQLFREYPVVLQRYQDRYGYLMVDEFQDTNVAQYQLSRQLSQGHQNFCVVGDPDQSIYSWRSADVRNILNFKNDYPRAKVISLGQNYRSTANILNAAKGLIESNGKRLDHQLFTDNSTGQPVRVDEAYDEDEEAGKVIGEIKRLTREESFKLGDCAVMYRVNAQSRAMEEACLQQGVKYRLVGGTRFYQRKEIRDLTAYLRLVYNQQDDQTLARVVSVPPRGLGAKSMQQLGEWATGRGVSTFDAMREITPVSLPSRAASSIAKFVDLIERLVAISREAEVVKLIDVLLSESGLQKHIQESDERPEERWENVMDFRGIAQEFNAETPPDGLGSLLERTSLVSQVDDLEDAEDSITLITLHQAKGLEFPVVFIVGMEEGLLPHSRSLDSEEQTEEERRLCYVGMTRAEQRLYLMRAFRRNFRGGSGGPAAASRFLREIPEDLLVPAALSSTAARTVTSPQPGGGSSIRAAALAAASVAPSSGPALKVGDPVRHRAFGDGIVMACEVTASDVEVTVEFAGGVGAKRLLLSFAPLEKLSDSEDPGLGGR
ncbi:ATP-dependent DNA helicase PcrA [Geodia barretti]|uniref:DNA 3'-5' helicase n=1 Tax=Geodia barretti TaxID=519541 RepID=A0AA35SLA0_GEOBA|nr:ATP-dependent DNA helicase PcrA [Geodia barretti]